MKSAFYTLAFIGLLLSSCSKKDSESKPLPYKIDTENVALHYDETHQFLVTQGTIEINAKTISWISSDESVATVDANGKLSGKKLGMVTLTATSGSLNLKSTVTIIPYSNLCREPYFEDGATVAVTKGRETRLLANETATSLLYTGENTKLRNAMYLFTDNKMTSASLLLANTTDVINESAKFYKERYTYLGTEKDTYFYGDNNNLVIGILLDAKLGLIAIYIKGNGKALGLTPKLQQQFNTVKANVLKQKAVL
jgi:hypothetical protein